MVARKVVLTVGATHLQNQRPSDPQPPEALAQLQALLDALTSRPPPWVLLGDLNLGPVEVVPVVEGAGLTAIVETPTFPSVTPQESIDWIAVGGADVVSTEVPDVRTSDHRPLVAVLGERPVGH